LITEINLARQINVAAYAMLPYTNGRSERADLAAAFDLATVVVKLPASHNLPRFGNRFAYNQPT